MALVLLPGCADEGSAPAWRATWEEALATIPAQEELVASDPRVPLCEQTLGELRALAGDLRDVPDPVIAPPVRAWIAEAESQFFECFEGLSDEQIGDVYDEFATLEAEVETALDRLRED